MGVASQNLGGGKIDIGARSAPRFFLPPPRSDLPPPKLAFTPRFTPPYFFSSSYFPNDQGSAACCYSPSHKSEYHTLILPPCFTPNPPFLVHFLTQLRIRLHATPPRGVHRILDRCGAARGAREKFSGATPIFLGATPIFKIRWLPRKIAVAL